MRDICIILLLLGSNILTWWIGFRDGRHIEHELAERHYRRQIDWLTAELHKTHEKLTAALRSQPGPPTTEPVWNPDQEPDHE